MPVETAAQDLPVVSHWLLPQGQRCLVGRQGQVWSGGCRVAEVAVPALVHGVGYGVCRLEGMNQQLKVTGA